MSEWRITWRDTGDIGLRENTIGTKYIRLMANIIGSESPDKEWLWTKELYLRAGKPYGRTDWRAVERACRGALAAAGLKIPVQEVVYELAEIAWERRELHGIPEAEWRD